METQRAEQTEDPSPTQPGQPTRSPALNSTRRRWIVSIFGDISRSGSWPPQPRMSPFTLFGDVDIDLTEASLPTGGVVINALAPFGNIDVVVADGTAVDAGGLTLFGSKRITAREATTDRRESPVRVRGFSLFGSLKVWSG